MIKKFNREYINSQVRSDPKAFVLECESCFNRQMDDVLEAVIEENHRVVCVAGPSSSGKTTFASMLSKRLEDRGYLPTTMSLVSTAVFLTLLVPSFHKSIHFSLSNAI